MPTSVPIGPRSAVWRTDTVPEGSFAITVDAYRVMSPSRCRSLRAVSPSNAVRSESNTETRILLPTSRGSFLKSRWFATIEWSLPPARMSGRRPIRPIPPLG